VIVNVENPTVDSFVFFIKEWLASVVAFSKIVVSTYVPYMYLYLNTYASSTIYKARVELS